MSEQTCPECHRPKAPVPDGTRNGIPGHCYGPTTATCQAFTIGLLKARVAELEALVESLRVSALKWEDLIRSLNADAEKRKAKP